MGYALSAEADLATPDRLPTPDRRRAAQASANLPTVETSRRPHRLLHASVTSHRLTSARFSMPPRAQAAVDVVATGVASVGVSEAD